MCGGLVLLSEVDVPCAEMNEQLIQSESESAMNRLSRVSRIKQESLRKRDIRK